MDIRSDSIGYNTDIMRNDTIGYLTAIRSDTKTISWILRVTQ